MSDPDDLAARLTFHPAPGGGCWIEPDNEYNVQIRNRDEIHMVRALKPGESLTLRLELGEEYGTTIQWLSFGRSSDDALRAERVIDTDGGYYPESPFKIQPGAAGSALLTVAHDPAAERFFEQLWYFDIWPTGRGPIHRIDPKIYNKGDGLERPAPGGAR